MDTFLASTSWILWVILLVDAFRLRHSDGKQAEYEILGAILLAIISSNFTYRSLSTNGPSGWEAASEFISMVMVVPLLLVALFASLVVWSRIRK
jgi:hypothetical protein